MDATTRRLIVGLVGIAMLLIAVLVHAHVTADRNFGPTEHWLQGE